MIRPEAHLRQAKGCLCLPVDEPALKAKLLELMGRAIEETKAGL